MKPLGSKLCVLDPDVQRIAIELAKKQARAGKGLISMGAADGRKGWDTPCRDTEEGMTPSDRQAFLAGVVQDALDADSTCGGARVGILGYGYCAPRPTRTINRRLIVAIAAAYFRGEQPPDDGDSTEPTRESEALDYEAVIAGYQAAGAVDLIHYGYLSTPAWVHNRPWASQCSNLARLRQEIDQAATIPGTLSMFVSEIGQHWGPDGGRLWAIAQLLQDRDQRIEDLDGQFKEAAFEASPAGHALLALLYDRTVGRAAPKAAALYALLRAVLEEPCSGYRRRALDIAIYARSLELDERHHASRDPDDFEAFVRFLWRARATDMVSFHFSFFDTALKAPLAALRKNYAPSPIGPWKNPWPDEPITESEILGWVGL
jgi:hypothetical protein